MLLGLGLAGSKMNSRAGWEGMFNVAGSRSLSLSKPTADGSANCSRHLAGGSPGVPLLLRAELLVHAGARSALPAAVPCPRAQGPLKPSPRTPSLLPPPASSLLFCHRRGQHTLLFACRWAPVPSLFAMFCLFPPLPLFLFCSPWYGTDVSRYVGSPGWAEVAERGRRGGRGLHW